MLAVTRDPCANTLGPERRGESEVAAIETQGSEQTTHDASHAGRQRIVHLSRLRWFHWVVIALSTALTLLAWRISSTMLEARAEQRLDAYALQAVELFTEKLESHADLLRASAGLVAASEEVTPAEWRRYTEALALAEQFPAISGLGVVYRIPRSDALAFTAEQRSGRPDFRLHPEHAEPIHLPLTLIAPQRLERAMTGFDLAHEPLRRSAIARAMAHGTVQITAPIDLANRGGVGFTMVAPFEASGTSEAGEPDSGRPAGAAVAAMKVIDLAKGALSSGERQVMIRVSDGDRTLYDELPGPTEELARASSWTTSRTLSLYGRQWHFEVRSTPAFHASVDHGGPHVILVGGLTIEALLLALFVAHARANRHCLVAEKANASLLANQAELESCNRTLETCNEELEAFAHVVSHDLKTPLNGLIYLAEFIEEDLADYEADPEARTRIATNVDRLKRHAVHGRALIDGVLAYSETGTTVHTAEEVGVGALLADIGDTLELNGEQLALSDDLPVLRTDRMRLEQVLTNLVGNALKYHPDRDLLRIRVGADRLDERTVRFSVSDNGPGIAKHDHERIFELFGTLGRVDDVDSTGVGLSIVKRTVERLGGSVSVESSPGCGATFVFDWPAHPTALDDVPKAA